MPVPDTPASIDQLGFDRFAVPFARTIAATDRSTTPWTIGVYGEWGSGKTTFLKLVEKELSGFRVRPIWFNAWKYARDDNLWAALIEKIVAEARRSVPWYRAPDVRLRIWLRSIDFGAGFFELFRKLGAIAIKVVMLAVLILMAISLVPVAGNPVTGWLVGNPLLDSPWNRVLVGVVAALGTKPEALLKLFDVKLGADLGAFRRSRAHRSQAALLDDFTAEFQGVLEVVYRKNPLVVIIDDLDRCLPEQTLQIIETVKLVLDEPGCVFLLAVDREVIEHAIRVKYKDLPSVGELGETFFEKIVQLPYSLPPPAEGRVESYIRSISSDEAVLACLPILRGTAPYNPRRIKRSVQAFTMLRGVSADLATVPSVLAKLVMLQAQFRQVYREAVNDHALLAQLEQVYRQPELEVDDVLRGRADQFAERYPGLKALFRVRLSAEDTFAEVPVESYLSIVDTVVVAEEPEQEPGPRSVLVSCMSTDYAWGERLGRFLRDAGEHVLITTPGQPITKPFHRVIAVWSRNSTGSPAVERLWADAVSKGVPFLAVRVDGATPSKFLLGRDSLDVVDMDDRDVKSALLARLGYTLRMPVLPHRWSNVPDPPDDLVHRHEQVGPLDERITALVGMPGAGKTMLALRYAADHRGDYRIVWRFRAKTILGDTALLADRLGVQPHEVVRELANLGTFLLIYDGFDDVGATKALFPGGGSGKVIVTSRNRDWAEHGSMVEVGPLSREQSVAFLDVENARLIAEEVGDLPLALACVKYGMRDAHYPRSVKERTLSLVGVLSDAFKQLDRKNTAACSVLRALSLLDPSPIAHDLLSRVVTGTEQEFDEAVRELARMSMIKVLPDGFDVHPVIRDFARDTMSGPALISSLMERLPVSGDRQALEQLRPHVRALTERAQAAPAEAANFLVRVGRGWLAVGGWHEAGRCAEDAVRLDPDNASAVALREDTHGRTVVLLGEPRAQLADQLRTAFGKERFEVVGSGDPVESLITSRHPIDCVVAVTDDATGPTFTLQAQVSLARSVGVAHAVGAVMRHPYAKRTSELDLSADYPDAFVVRPDSGEKVLELAHLIRQMVLRRSMGQVGPVPCTQFQAVLMAREGTQPSSVDINFGAAHDTASVRVLTGNAPRTSVAVFELGTPVSITVGTRFDSDLGRGVVTRISE
ncbi:P-loop NTPase fold protein [Streptomyces sp. ID05-26A]|nr:P-loop NTPase fold protein [Streptomyces sp. ID05-26A]